MKQVEATEADREAAWPHRYQGAYGEDSKEAWLSGRYDRSDIIQAFARHRQQSDLKLALDWALSVLIQFEPGDSRAVSDEFVAAAAIQAGIDDNAEECGEILHAAMANQDDSGPIEQPATWEAFCDTSYFDMWCVRKMGDKTFGSGFHLVNKEGAEQLRDYLNGISNA